MSISMQNLIVALVAVVGVAVALSVALGIAGTIWQRGRNQATLGLRPAIIPAQQPTQTDDARELVLH